MNKIIGSIILCTSLANLSAQDVKAIRVTGHVNLSSQYSLSNNFYSYLNGKLSLKFKKYELPITFRYSNRDLSVSYPFNRMSFSPKIGKVKILLGLTNITFNSQILQGFSFAGAGIIAPIGEKTQVKLFFGRSRKANNYDSLLNAPVFQRKATGIEISHNYNKLKLKPSLLLSSDNENSLLEEKSIQPETNLVMGIESNYTLNTSLGLHLSIYNSSITQFNYPSDRSENNRSIKAELNYKFSESIINVQYSRIDPNYRSHGLPFINNDMENISVGLNTSSTQIPIRLSIKGGFQQNNLQNLKTTKRIQGVGSINISGKVFRNIDINLTSSNFRTYSNYIPTEIFFGSGIRDSLQFLQVSSRHSLSIRNVRNNSRSSKSISLNTNFQEVQLDGKTTGFFNSILNYRVKNKKGGNLNFGFNINSKSNWDFSFGPSFGYGIQRENIKINLRSAAVLQENSLLINNSFSINYKVSKYFSARLNILNSYRNNRSFFQTNLNLNFRIT